MSDEEFDILDDENSHVAASQHVEDGKNSNFLYFFPF